MTPELWDQMVKILELSVIPFAVWVTRTLNTLTSEIRSLKEALVGMDGRNGIRSKVEKLDTQVSWLVVRYAMKYGESPESPK